jgi:putative amidase-like protein
MVARPICYEYMKHRRAARVSPWPSRSDRGPVRRRGHPSTGTAHLPYPYTDPIVDEHCDGIRLRDGHSDPRRNSDADSHRDFHRHRNSVNLADSLSHPGAHRYNGAAAAAYADAYWSSYNPAWPSFANTGGDCANFVSQALYAGSIAMRPSPPYRGAAAWYMIDGHRWSYSTSWVMHR